MHGIMHMFAGRCKLLGSFVLAVSNAAPALKLGSDGDERCSPYTYTAPTSPHPFLEGNGAPVWFALNGLIPANTILTSTVHIHNVMPTTTSNPTKVRRSLSVRSVLLCNYAATMAHPCGLRSVV